MIENIWGLIYWYVKWSSLSKVNDIICVHSNGMIKDFKNCPYYSFRKSEYSRIFVYLTLCLLFMHALWGNITSNRVEIVSWGQKNYVSIGLWLHFHFSLSCIGERNGNPLQCSCLENHRDGGALWAAVYGVAQSWTQLKWLSSSSMILQRITVHKHMISVDIYIYI